MKWNFQASKKILIREDDICLQSLPNKVRRFSDAASLYRRSLIPRYDMLNEDDISSV